MTWTDIIEDNFTQIVEFGKMAFDETKANKKEHMVVISGTERMCCYLFPASDDIKVGEPFENIDGTPCLAVLRFLWDENLMADLDVEASITYELKNLIKELKKD